MRTVKLGIVGCGAVARIHHLQALAGCDSVTVSALVDQSLPRAQELAERYKVSGVLSDYRDLIGEVDAAIVALPNYLHCPVTVDLLKAGVHVLVEKPMALKTADCDKMINAARSTGAVLAVGLDFRFINALQFAKQLLQQGMIGNIRKFDLRLGVIMDWPSVSDSLLHIETAGGGVLVDFGVHLLDLLLWWLGDYENVEYFDDARGGIETDCELRLRLTSGAFGTVELSRSRQLRNTCCIHGECGVLEVGIWEPNPPVRLQINNDGIVLDGRTKRDNLADQTWQHIFRRQHDDFIGAIVNNRPPFVPGSEGRRAIGLVEACYASRRPLSQPWSSIRSTPAFLKL
jgi:predicted dehydrogenase